MKFMFSTVYRVTQKDFYARPYTSMWAPVVARQISKRYSSSCHVFISTWAVISSTASMTRCLKISHISNFSPLHKVLNKPPCWFETRYHWGSWAYNTSHADKHVGRAWISFRYLSSYNRRPHWSVWTCIKIFLSYSIPCWKHKFHKAFRY